MNPMTTTQTLPLTLGNAGALDWWKGLYRIERVCTCKHKSAECRSPRRAFHCVDSADDLEAAQAEVARLEGLYKVDYRVTDSRTGRVVG